jgi:Zn-dependent peptidase ImmA (M78 family)/transcriptional regulator with XRE-family HTH domain
MTRVDANVTFCPARLKIARAFNGLAQREVAELVGTGQQFIARLESGAKEPTEVMAAALGDTLGFEAGFFYGKELDEFRDDECAFRRRRMTQISVRATALAYGTLFGQLLRYLGTMVRFPSADVPNIPAHADDEIDSAAAKCRTYWRLAPDLPIGNMVRVAESAGVPVAKFRGLADKIDAFSRGRAPNLIVLTDKAPSRCRFDVAHELGHLVLHRGIQTGTKEIEAQANRFAAAFLLPKRFLHEFPRNLHNVWETLFRLKKQWKASLGAMIKTAHTHRVITPSQYVRLYKDLSARGWLKSEPYEFEAENPQIIMLAFDVIGRTSGVSLDQVPAALAWKRATFEKITGVTFEPQVPPRAKVLPLIRTGRA